MIHRKALTTSSSRETEEVAESLAREIEAGQVVLLEGDLAAGKTTFVRGLVRGLGGDPDEVSSPTFVIVQSYPCRRVQWLHHVDCYRLEDDPGELRNVGMEEVLDDTAAIIAVEWPKTSVSQLMTAFGPNPITVTLRSTGETTREIEITAP